MSKNQKFAITIFAMFLFFCLLSMLFLIDFEKSKKGNDNPCKNGRIFKDGELVVLKSGGPLMTIRGSASDYLWSRDRIVCDFFDDKNNLITELFDEESLTTGTLENLN